MSFEEKICIMLECKYLEKNGRTIKDDNDDLLPMVWFNNYDFHLKCEILAEALKKGILVMQTEKFAELVNDVKEK